jgi:MSHA biogenesis protein MshI
MFKNFYRKNSGLRAGLLVSKTRVLLIIVFLKPGEQPIIKAVYSYSLSDELTLSACCEAVKKIVKANNYRHVPCYCVLPEMDCQLLLTEPPEVPENEMADAIRWKVKELIDSSIVQPVIDIFMQPGKKMIYAAIAEKTAIENIIDFAAESGLALTIIDIPELAIRNVVDYLPLVERGVAFVLLRSNEGKILIVKEGNVYLTRRFVIHSDTNKLDALFEDDIVLELQRSLDYYERQMGQVSPADIVFAGEVLEADLFNRIKDNFPQKVSSFSFNFLKNESTLTVDDEDHVLTLGAALRRDVA